MEQTAPFGGSVGEPFIERFEGDHPREHWRILDECLNAEFSEISRLHSLAESLLREDGATYSVYSDPAGLNRAWPLDLPPVLLPRSEWQSVSDGIKQRAELLDLVLRDVYGEQRLLREGVIPAQLIFAHPGYVRAWVGADRSDRKQLSVYGMDLARHPGGQFHVIGDRTQNPSGSGYALENRVVMARILPDLFRDSHVLRLARYFRALRDRLTDLAPDKNDNPRVALLTPGSRNETYFEQSFLASYLGISLVEGQDLHVHKGKVWIRSLETEEPVDVILRRVDDDYCDPLEFRGESLLGVAGLTEVARRGNVAIVNPVGSGVLENPGIYPYLAKAAGYFGLGDLLLPQVETWWCGDERQRKHVLGNLQAMILKPVWRGGETRSVAGGSLDKSALNELKNKIRSNPENWVAQRDVPLSLVPGLGEFQLQDYNMILRGFAVAGNEDYSVMSGGLTRVGQAKPGALVSNQAGSRSKDTWILSSDPDAEVSLWIHPQHKLDESAPERLVQGRSADNLFWMGRYSERSDLQLNLLRLIGRRLGTAESFNDLRPASSRRWFMRLLSDISLLNPVFVDLSATATTQDLHTEFHSFCTDGVRAGSLAFNLGKMTLAARKVHVLLSGDMRRVTGEIGDTMDRLKLQGISGLEQKLPLLLQMKDQMLALNCLTGQSMIRGLAWRFLDSGRRLERALSLLRLLKLLIVEPSRELPEYEQLGVLLALNDNDVNYHQRYGMTITTDRVLDLLLLEVNNPRSLAYQINQLAQHADNLPGSGDASTPATAERYIVEASSTVRLANSMELARQDEEQVRRLLLEEFLDKIQQQLLLAAEEIAASYFSRVSEQQQTLSPVIR